ncbi:Phragmoplastin DRP1C-like protein [Drosera capensis]
MIKGPLDPSELEIARYVLQSRYIPQCQYENEDHIVYDAKDGPDETEESDQRRICWTKQDPCLDDESLTDFIPVNEHEDCMKRLQRKKEQLSQMLDEDPALMSKRETLAKRFELYKSARDEIDSVAWE